MKQLLAIFLTGILILSFSQESEAQWSGKNRRKLMMKNRKMTTWRGKRSGFNKSKRYHYFGFSVNSFNYFGDLAPVTSATSTDLSLTKPGFGVHWGHRYGPRYTFRASFKYGTLSGSDFESADPYALGARSRYVRNLHFRNRIKEITLTGMFDLFKNEASYISRVAWTPYIFGGITVFHHNPKAVVPATDLNGNAFDNAGEWVALQPLGTEGQNATLPDTAINAGIKPYKRIQIAIPLGLGVRFRLNEVLDLAIESSFRYLFTDYIDDVSGNYVDLIHLDGELARALSDRSREATDAQSGSERDFVAINAATGGIVENGAVIRPGISRTVDGGYEVWAGFGQEFRDNLRGNTNDNDFYIVTTIKLSYILGGSFRRAKFR